MRYLKDVSTITLYPERCTGCGTCLEVCPHQLFVLEGKRAALTDRDRCMECGACARNCPAEAITVRAGVGCAQAILAGRRRGSEPCCGDPGGCCVNS